ncbi:CDP-archaeol synthase [Campylobacter sp. RM12640]|uniref:phosphatidate cytidylyltransferase n=1 Tax=unclassified Campylobacter TaxID=2593542 RepID=UPI0030152D3F|nr:CDP-archaeol synthase [Campylobacter sp. RM12637]MBZ7981793.1 CDP-archaeol synthase [Campylobacter sp. RM12640]MBZ7988671.1 CDP-archaeol synthase [Campylobacter sp. RM12635]
MLNEKIKTGLIFAIIAVIFLAINSYYLWLIIFLLASGIGYFEACKLFDTKNNYLILALGLILGIYTQMPVVSMIFAILVLASFLAYKQGDLKEILPFIYAGIGISFIFETYIRFELSGFIWLLLSVVLCDSFAYFVGKKYGKTSFSPSSPNKTLEGVIGGIIISTIVSSIYASFVYSEIGFLEVLFLSFLMAFFAVFGDLFESYLKRLAKVKDSGELFPGHGGVLDRVDALIFASIIMVVFL